MIKNPGNSAYDIAIDFKEVKEGDFSLNEPTKLYHGSARYKHEEGEPLVPKVPRYQAERGGKKKDIKGIYLTPSRKMSESYGRAHEVELPRKAHMRVDPQGHGFAHSGSMLYGDPVPHKNVKPLPLPPHSEGNTPLHEQEPKAYGHDPINYPHKDVHNPINNLETYREARKNKNLVFPANVPYEDRVRDDIADIFHEHMMGGLREREARSNNAKRIKAAREAREAREGSHEEELGKLGL